MNSKNNTISKDEFLLKYWQYYLRLEEDFMSTIRYISLSQKNKKTFSIEYVKQLLTICSEVDVIFQMLTGKKTINKYLKYLQNDDYYKKILEEKVKVFSSLEYWEITPYHLSIDEEGRDYLSWWRIYNSVKHQRINSYELANLENVLTSLAALYTLEEYYFQKNFYKEEMDESVPIPKLKLFSCTNLTDNYCDKFEAILAGYYEDK